MLKKMSTKYFQVQDHTDENVLRNNKFNKIK